MSDPLVLIIPTYVLIFDGTNQAEMWAEMSLTWANMSVSASSAPGSAASFTIITDLPNNGPQTIEWEVGDGFNRINPGYGYLSKSTLADPATFMDLTKFVQATAPAATLAVGYAPTPSIAGGDSETVTVPMVPALPDDGYAVSIALAGGSQLLGSLQVIGHDVISASAVDVTVRNNGILALGGATVLVTALHNG